MSILLFMSLLSPLHVATNNLDLTRDRDVVHKLRRSIAENTNSPSNHEEERRRRNSKLAVALFCCRKKAKLINWLIVSS